MTPTAATSCRNQLRVCHVAYTFYENDGRVRRYAEAMAERGDKVHVVALRRAGQAKLGHSGSVRVYRIQRRTVSEKRAWTYLLKTLWFAAKSAALLTVMQFRVRYDVIHVHNVPDFLVFAALAPRLMGAKIILDIHDIVPELYAGKFGSIRASGIFKLLLQVERLSCKFSHHVIVANAVWHEKLVRRAVVAERCTSILNYPDLRLFSPLPQQSRRTDNKFVILYPGTLNHHQGVDIALRAFALLTKRIPNAEFHIYGEGPARPHLERLSRDCGLAGRVKIMDRVPLNQVARVMASADIGVVPKRADGFGNEAFSTKTLEFMACAVPVVTSQTLIDTYYFDETVIRFFTPGDERELADVLLSEYMDETCRSERVNRARLFAARNSWQARKSDYLDIVDGLVESAVPGRKRLGSSGL